MKKLLLAVASILVSSPCFSQVQSISFKTLGGGDPRTIEIKGGGDPYTVAKRDCSNHRLHSLEGGGDPFVEDFSSTGR